jgi:hypothetical protein
MIRTESPGRKLVRLLASWDFWHVWGVGRDSIVRGQGFTDRDAALEAAELRE